MMISLSVAEKKKRKRSITVFKFLDGPINHLEKISKLDRQMLSMFIDQ